MIDLAKHFNVDFEGMANEDAIITCGRCRFTVLTSKLIRIEYDKDSIFEDRPTQIVVNRSFPVPKFEVIDEPDSLQIITKHLKLYYNKKDISKEGLYIELKNKARWHYGDELKTLKGTATCLDFVDGFTELSEGIVSKDGFSVLNDSYSVFITQQGWIHPRKKRYIDIYVFGYEREYLQCIKDYFKLTGRTPLLPRYALGNWWSRFHKYDEKELKTLIKRFKEEDIPFTVCVIDMDWHLVDIDKIYGSGWTGYTWNKQLFPNPQHMLEWLHKENYKVTLNLHPADGVRGFEQMYEPMAKALGIDYKNQQKIPFNSTNIDFMKAYFKYLHHPLEKQGVDFWWIDWQQSSHTNIRGLTPLWMLNHYHFYDMKKDNKRPLILSRYAGIGSHRYPVGFSGDTQVTWDSYKFQPYFTSTASNIGYCWWSHDIGGHYIASELDYKTDELITRWIQYGVFSPIMRLHSSGNEYISKEPWRYDSQYEKTIKEHLRLRHQLIPYIYTMNYRLHAQGIPFIQPMYYQYPNDEDSYEVKNQYFFGSELIVVPITEPINTDTNVSQVKVWLPKGNWTDFYSGEVYSGGQNLNMCRNIESQVVLIKAGGIIPLARYMGTNKCDNPKDLDIMVFLGEDNVFELYEDQGENMDYQGGEYAITKIKTFWGDEKGIKVEATTGSLDIVPEYRNIRFLLRGVKNLENIQVNVDNKQRIYKTIYDERSLTQIIEIGKVSPAEEVSVVLD